MSALLVKIFATALTLSQVVAQPDAVKTSFDPVHDKAEVSSILTEGCAYMRRAFGIEDIDIDALISTAMDDPQAVVGNMKALHGLDFGALHASYRLYCKKENVESPVDLGEVIAYYNQTAADLPDAGKLKSMSLPGMSRILDESGKPFAEVYEPDQRRIWVPLSDIPATVQQAFVSTEDRRFYEHKGVDERGVIRAFIGNMVDSGRPSGGSTITQQVAKNLLVGDDLTYDRKIREMIVASRIEHLLTKQQILETYLNAIYFGRASWGIEMAAQSYFGKSAKLLTASEGALLAALAKGPNYYDPDRHPDRARERMAYVVGRMQEDGALTPDQAHQMLEALPKTVANQRERRHIGFHFVDHIARELRTLAGVESLTAASYSVRSTLHPELQAAAEGALQEGLARYEMRIGRQRFEAAEANLADAVKALKQQDKSNDTPAWRRALQATRLPLYDVQWPAAVVVEQGAGAKGRAGTLRVGLEDGRILPLKAWEDARRKLKLYDVVRVHVTDPKGKTAARADLRAPPSVQGAAVVLENRTGRVLALTGGFSYPLSQLNRATQAHRQPGSAFKPVTYLAALAQGLQPNTLIWDTPLTLPPVEAGEHLRASDYWSPKNYDGSASGIVTMRRALEKSKNLATARLLDGGIDTEPARSLRRVCDIALEARLYLECVPYYPFVLGAQPVRVLDLAAFYAAIANEGALPSPYVFESVDRAGKRIYTHESRLPVQIGSADRAAFFQIKTMLQGVVQRGTASSLHALAPYVAGKTGTSDNENDAWFAGFTNDVTIAVWVGYDNADGKHRTLGRGQTGAKVALPIFKDILDATWAHYAAKSPLRPPSPQAAQDLVTMQIDLESGDRITDGRKGFTEYFRLSPYGQIKETQFRLVPEGEAYAAHAPAPWSGDEEPSMSGDPYGDSIYGRAPEYFDRSGPDPYLPRGRARSPWGYDAYGQRSRRVDPDYFWGNGGFYP